MRRILLMKILLLLFILPMFTLQAQKFTATTGEGVNVTCPEGGELTNGVEVVVNMRPGFVYTATAIGIGGFDPVMAIVDNDVTVACVDNTADVGAFTAILPTTGEVSGSGLGAQLPFSHNYDNLADISVVVGGVNGSGGEFVLILEGMAVTEPDGLGDPFYLRVTPNMTTTPVNASVYMLATTQQLDPLIQWVRSDNEEVILQCDDAGTQFCEDNTLPPLGNAIVSRSLGRETAPSARNTMLMLPTTELQDADFSVDNFFHLRMTSFGQTTTGDYAVVFHLGIDGSAEGTDNKDNPPVAGQTPPPPPENPPGGQRPGPSTAGGGVNVTCPDGTEITNGVEVIVNMRPGFTYTATALGIDDFDPIMAIADGDTVVDCLDDSQDAANITAELPTTGRVPASRLNAQMPFSHNYNEFADISIIVGGFAGIGGEFVLILEGMAITELDGDGDPFTVNFTPNIVNGGVDMTAYMLRVDNSLDPVMRLVAGGETLLECDDAGSEFCEDGTTDLSSARVARVNGPAISGNRSDTMLTVPTRQFRNLDFSEEVYLPFLMTSFGGTQGQYIVAFHFGIAH